jgi:regulator of sigma D
MSEVLPMRKLIDKWKSERDDCIVEAKRLESSDPTRHATSISMLEAKAQTLERCTVELETVFASK